MVSLDKQEEYRDKRVLIIDDEKSVADLIKFVLTKNDYYCNVAHSGREALDLLKMQNFDLLLLDTSLPDISGIEVLKTIKQDDILKHTKVVLMTASADLDSQMAKKLGALDYWQKPISKKDLLEGVLRYIKS
jgi:CheY-like chemotaxis protein